jgi:hypothetical protein
MLITSLLFFPAPLLGSASVNVHQVRHEVVPSTLILLCSIVPLQQKAVT